MGVMGAPPAYSSSSSSSVNGYVYRLICPNCKEPTDIPTKDWSSYTTGAGRDYTGSYDSGYQVTTAKCNICAETIRLKGSIDSNVKEERIFKIFKK